MNAALCGVVAEADKAASTSTSSTNASSNKSRRGASGKEREDGRGYTGRVSRSSSLGSVAVEKEQPPGQEQAKKAEAVHRQTSKVAKKWRESSSSGGSCRRRRRRGRRKREGTRRGMAGSEKGRRRLVPTLSCLPAGSILDWLSRVKKRRGMKNREDNEDGKVEVQLGEQMGREEKKEEKLEEEEGGRRRRKRRRRRRWW
ncbi:hypothetical protein VYU27_004163 [Nannochloropsis oceanica]